MKLRKGDIVNVTNAHEWLEYSFSLRTVLKRIVQTGEVGIIESRAPWAQATDDKPRTWHYRVAFPACFFSMMVPEEKLEKLGRADG